MNKCEIETEIKETEKKLADLKNKLQQLDIPLEIRVGQVYLMHNDLIMMVATIGGSQLGLTCVSPYPGTYMGWYECPNHSNSEIREFLIIEGAQYLGNFENLFIRKNNK